MPTSSESETEVAIRCCEIGKRYRIGPQGSYRTLRDTIADTFRAPFRRRTTKQDSTGHEAHNSELWALDGINFEVQRGEVLGIIGRNGSGKSTLLKLLSGITRPSRGRIEIRGRLGTLLEVGAGFHPELTGRENIYLNGAILGMKRREIARKFDEIVDFSECGHMLDTPIKHYSSGMYVRLAFSVAAHLETEILLVDEVLAVGDSVFQKKCLGKIGQAAHQGRTVLFVSHNLLAVDSLCTRAICLHEGKIVQDGSPSQVTSTYLKKWIPTFSEVVYDDIHSAPGNDQIRLRRARVRPLEETTGGEITVNTPFIVEFEYWKLAAIPCIDFAVQIFNEHGVNVFATAPFEEPASPAGLLRSSFQVPAHLMNNGTYQVHLYVFMNHSTVIAEWEDLITFEVLDAPSKTRGSYLGGWPGALRPHLEWKRQFLEPLPASVQASSDSI